MPEISQHNRQAEKADVGHDNHGLLKALIGDGRPLLLLSGFALVLAGEFALFLSATKHFLPHDVDYLGMTAEQLCGFNNCRVVYFMFHDRVAFGGALLAIGALYMWLAEFPLRQRQAWAWWTFVVSGIFGFGSFLAYPGYGYLDTWHGVATLPILPCFITGLVKLRSYLQAPTGIGSLLRPGPGGWLAFAFRVGSGASSRGSGRHDCGRPDCDDLWHDARVCATGFSLHGPGKVGPADNQRAPDTLNCPRPRGLWRRDLYHGNHRTSLRVVRQTLKEPLADIVFRRGRRVCSKQSGFIRLWVTTICFTWRLRLSGQSCSSPV
ncbi:MAG: hypothetical protein ACRD9S_00080 [Pyrinomonadaceae bacterium]